jgi:hypothetical protein
MDVKEPVFQAGEILFFTRYHLHRITKPTDSPILNTLYYNNLKKRLIYSSNSNQLNTGKK